MKNIFKLALPILFLLFLIKPAMAAPEKSIYFFHAIGCPHCVAEEKFLEKMEVKYPELNVERYEVGKSLENAKLLSKVGQELKINIRGVPVTVIGDKNVIGYFDDEITGAKIESLINNYLDCGHCLDVVKTVINEENEKIADFNNCRHGCDLTDEECMHDCGCVADTVKKEPKQEKVNIPFFGERYAKDFSLPILTIVIGILDGFNPCAMWVLLFLISLLLNMKDRKKMWILGSVFIFTSGFVYFLFLAAWLNLFLFISFISFIRYAIALVAVGSGIYHIREFFINKSGTCKVTKGEGQQKVFAKLKKIVSSDSFWFSFFGIILLAGAVNLVELVCSAGLPAVYTQVLALSDLSIWQYHGYLILYIFFFTLDDIIVFFIAMTTLKMTFINSKYSRFSSIIGGIIMVIIGILLVFMPSFLMFG